MYFNSILTEELTYITKVKVRVARGGEGCEKTFNKRGRLLYKYGYKKKINKMFYLECYFLWNQNMDTKEGSQKTEAFET